MILRGLHRMIADRCKTRRLELGNLLTLMPHSLQAIPEQLQEADFRNLARQWHLHPMCSLLVNFHGGVQVGTWLFGVADACPASKHVRFGVGWKKCVSMQFIVQLGELILWVCLEVLYLTLYQYVVYA
jgi:hypothetical protein